MSCFYLFGYQKYKCIFTMNKLLIKHTFNILDIEFKEIDQDIQHILRNLKHIKVLSYLERFITDNTLFFATYTSSNKVKHYQNNPKACVYFFQKGKNFQGLMITGLMEIVDDIKIKEKLWTNFYYKFYKKGINDPQYCILKFICEQAQWFSNFQTETINMK